MTFTAKFSTSSLSIHNTDTDGKKSVDKTQISDDFLQVNFQQTPYYGQPCNNPLARHVITILHLRNFKEIDAAAKTGLLSRYKAPMEKKTSVDIHLARVILTEPRLYQRPAFG